jgi:hypothetical protein
MESDLDPDRVAIHVRRDIPRDYLKNGKKNIAKRTCRTLISRELLGVIRRVVVPCRFQGYPIPEASELQPARIGFDLLGGIEPDHAAEIERKREMNLKDFLIDGFELREVLLLET